MSHPESFLNRWSRRKLAADAPAEERKPGPASCEVGPQQTSAPSRQGTEPEQPDDGSEGKALQTPSPRTATDDLPMPNLAGPPFDPLSLPPIEAIGPETDIRGFLAPGVPAELSRAALRRAWAADPKIRDFVGPADYDWDFNAPGAIAGFGPLEMTDEMRQVAARIIGQISGPERPNSTTDQASGNADQADNPAPMPAAVPAGHQAVPGENAATAADAAPQQNLTHVKKLI